MSNDDTFDAVLLAAINDPGKWDDRQGVTMALVHDLAEECSGDAYEAACRLIFSRRAFISVPLALMDFDTVVMPVTWEVGHSSRADIIARFGKPHLERGLEAECAVVYDLYVEDVETPYPAPPQPYESREASAEWRPEGCNVPYGGIWPPEALQIEFAFDAGGRLQRFALGVGERVT